MIQNIILQNWGARQKNLERWMEVDGMLNKNKLKLGCVYYARTPYMRVNTVLRLQNSIDVQFKIYQTNNFICSVVYHVSSTYNIRLGTAAVSRAPRTCNCYSGGPGWNPGGPGAVNRDFHKHSRERWDCTYTSVQTASFLPNFPSSLTSTLPASLATLPTSRTSS